MVNCAHPDRFALVIEDAPLQYVELRAAMPWTTVFGGCCGSDLRHVSEIARAVLG